MSAEVIVLFGRRSEADLELDIDLRTAVDVAIRDLGDIRRCWGTELGRQRLRECEEMLRRVFAAA